MDLLKELNFSDPTFLGGSGWEDINPNDSGNIVTDNSNVQQAKTNASTSASQLTTSTIGMDNPLEKFLEVISTYPASIPLKPFWYMSFKIPNLISEDVLNNVTDQSFPNNDSAKSILSRDLYMNRVGCVFCRSFNFVGESNSGDAPEFDTRSYRTSPYAGGRSNRFLQSLDISFYESTVSFIDHIIRPWTILMSHYSTIARDSSVSESVQIADLKQDLTFFLLTRTGVGQTSEERQKLINLNKSGRSGNAIPNITRPFAVRKTIIFKNCFPRNFGNLDYVQMEGNSFETASVNFSYSNYTVQFGEPNSLLINNI